MQRVRVRPPQHGDAEEFLRAVGASKALHQDWVNPPSTQKAFADYVDRPRENYLPFLVERVETGAIAGVINASEIVRASFQSAYLGYYAFESSAGLGLLKVGMSLVLAELFKQQALHRVEANIQPENFSSIAFVRSLGFTQEGYSPRYLKIGGHWRDHERWALLSDEWQPFSL